MLRAVVIAAHGTDITFVVLITALGRIGHLVAIVMVGHIGGDICLIVVENDRCRTVVARRIVVPIPW